MKHCVLKFSDSALGGSEWRWEFYVQRLESSWTVSAKQFVLSDDAMHLEPKRGRKSGQDIFRALASMVAEAGYHFDAENAPKVAAILDGIDPQVARDFRKHASEG